MHRLARKALQLEIKKVDTTFTCQPLRIVNRDAVTEAVIKLATVWAGYGRDAQPFTADVRFFPMGEYVAHERVGYTVGCSGYRWSYFHPSKTVMKWYSHGF